MCRSGFTSRTSASTCMSPAFTSRRPFTSKIPFLGPSPCSFRRTSLRLRMISVTSSITPGRVENSCSTPSMRTAVMAAPSSDDRSTRRGALPSVMPNPRSRGSMTNLPYPVVFPASATTCFGMVRFFHFIRQPPRGERVGSLRVELDDELLVDRRGDRRAGRDADHAPARVLGAQRQPLRRGLPLARLERVHDDGHLAALLAHLDLVARAHQERGDVHLAPVHREVTVPHQLAGLVPVHGEPEPVDHVVEAPLEHLEQDLARDALRFGGLLEVVAELPLEDAVHPARLLLLAQLHAVVGLLDAAALAVLARGVRAALDGALVGVAARALEVELHARTPAHPAPGILIDRHGALLDPAPLGRAAAVVRDRGDVLDGGDLEAGRLQRADGRLA